MSQAERVLGLLKNPLFGHFPGIASPALGLGCLPRGKSFGARADLFWHGGSGLLALLVHPGRANFMRIDLSNGEAEQISEHVDRRAARSPFGQRSPFFVQGTRTARSILQRLSSAKSPAASRCHGGPRSQRRSKKQEQIARSERLLLPKQQQPNKPLSPPPLRRIHRPLRQMRQRQAAPAPSLSQSRRISWSQPPNSALDRLARRAAHRAPQLSQNFLVHMHQGEAAGKERAAGKRPPPQRPGSLRRPETSS